MDKFSPLPCSAFPFSDTVICQNCQKRRPLSNTPFRYQQHAVSLPATRRFSN